MTSTAAHDSADRRRGWLVFFGPGFIGAGESIDSAYDDARTRCEVAGAALPLTTNVRPCSLAELDNALAMLQERPGVGRLARRAFQVDGQRHFRILGNDVPAANRADIQAPISITWHPSARFDTANAHGKPVYPKCPDCSSATMRNAGDAATLECTNCGSHFLARGIRPPASTPPRPGPENVALLRRQAAEMCEAAAAHLRRQDDARAQALVVDARRTVQELHAQLALHNVDRRTEALEDEPPTSPDDR